MLLPILSIWRLCGADGAATTDPCGKIPPEHRQQVTPAADPTQKDPYAGHVMVVNTLDLIDIKEAKLLGKPSLFSDLDPTCYETVELRDSQRNTKFLTSKEDLYDAIGVQVGLHGSGIVDGVNIGLTIDTEFSKSSWSSTSFNAAWFVDKADVKAVTVRDSCYNLSSMNPDIKSSFLQLELNFNPTRAIPEVSDFRGNFRRVREFFLPYVNFVEYVGVLVMRTITYGTRVDIFWSASSDFKGSHQDFQVAVGAKASMLGLGEIGLDVSVRGNHSESSSHQLITENVIIKGGSRAERIFLHAASQNKKLCFEKYMNEFLQSNGMNVVSIEWAHIWVYLIRFANSIDIVAQQKQWHKRIDNLKTFYYTWYNLPTCDNKVYKGRCLCGRRDYLFTGLADICEKHEKCLLTEKCGSR